MSNEVRGKLSFQSYTPQPFLSQVVTYFVDSFSLTFFPDVSFKTIGQGAHYSLLKAWKKCIFTC